MFIDWIGAYAEYIAVSVDMLIRKPAEMGWEEAAGIPEVSSPYPYPCLQWVYVPCVN